MDNFGALFSHCFGGVFIYLFSRDSVQPTLYHYSENGSRPYGCFSTQIVAFVCLWTTLVLSSLIASVAFQGTEMILVAIAYNQHFTIIVKMAVDDTDAFRRK